MDKLGRLSLFCDSPGRRGVSTAENMHRSQSLRSAAIWQKLVLWQREAVKRLGWGIRRKGIGRVSRDLACDLLSWEGGGGGELEAPHSV
jgi:hypothetical protein